MTILTLGDSFTFGAELSDLPSPVAGFFGDDYYDQTSHQTIKMAPSGQAWPSLLATQLAQPVDNHSVIGGSNSRIFRRAISDSSQKNYSLVICAWTQLSRIDIAYQDRECPAAANNPKWPWMKNYFADHFSEFQEQQRLLAQMLALQSYFKLRQLPYLFIKSFPIAFRQELNYLYNQLDLNYCVSWDSSMTGLTARLPRGRHGHFLEDGHKVVADVIFEAMSSLNMLTNYR